MLNSNNLRRLSLATMAIVAAVVASPVAAKAKTKPIESPRAISWTMTACPFDMDKRVRCGELKVPENWSKPGKAIVSRVVVISASDAANRKADPLVFLTGGPGVSAFAFIDTLSALPMTADRDLIIVEPRGYGYAEPALLCDGEEDKPLCAKRLTAKGIDLGQYGTANMVRDLEALRGALNVKQWNVFGVSYGTFSASHYARMFPASIRTLILDSPYPPGAGFSYGYAASLNAFDRVFEHCKADKACNAAYPDLKLRFIAALQNLKKSPVTVEGMKIDGGTAFEPIYGALYETESLPSVPQMVDALARRDFASLFGSPGGEDSADKPADTGKRFDPSRYNATGLHASVVCSEITALPISKFTSVSLKSPWPDDIKKMIRPEGWDFPEICKTWPVATAPAEMAVHRGSTIPTIIMVGAFDPTTPPELGESFIREWPNATLFVHPGAAHVVVSTGDPCVFAAIDTLLSKSGAPLDRSCLVGTLPKWEMPAKDK
jgi:pimeloyl-ACP methyl ester carboxylesterase